jgi:schlafen family protein
MSRDLSFSTPGMADLWIPRSVQELEGAVSSSAVTETTYLDFKSYPTRTDAGRIGIARDIAAMSVDGGVFIFGVAEKGGGFELDPQPVDQWREWVSQVALNAIQPAARVSTLALERTDGTGYLVVIVPASARAPHMVGGRYYGRADTTNFQMTDQQARSLWLRNLDRRDSGLALLRNEVAREPASDEMRTTARMFVVAQPVSADPRLLLDAVEDRNLRRWVSALAAHRLITHRQTYNPGIHSTNEVSRRARGAARSTYYLAPDRTVRNNGNHAPSATDLVDLEIHEDGGLRLYYGRASDWREGQHLLLTAAIVGEVGCCIELSRHVAEVSGFHGAWIFGVALHGLRSASAYNSTMILSGDTDWPYSEDSYEEVHEADYTELHEENSPVLDELLGRFVRSILPHGQAVTDFDLFPVSRLSTTSQTPSL